MSLSIGIVGLPNVGKSTTFNALTKAQNAQAANYPFCTIEPNKAIVPVPDERLDRLAELIEPKRILNATIEFVDIAGLIQGASQGEGLGNQFLANIRETSVIVHVVRCFEDENVIHVNGKIDPIGDVEIIQTELLLADLQQLERKVERLTKQVRGDRKLQSALDFAKEVQAHLEEGEPVSNFPRREEDAFEELNKEMRFLTGKQVIYASNVDEDGLADDNEFTKALKEYAANQNAQVIKLCAKLEEEMAGLEDDERREFLQEAGAAESGLDQVIRESFAALGLINYFTAGVKEVRAWTIRKGWTAPQAAGVIHSDFERGFIRAEVIPYETFIEQKGEAGAKASGLMRVEGKEYVVADGDVMHFRFNV